MIKVVLNFHHLKREDIQRDFFASPKCGSLYGCQCEMWMQIVNALALDSVSDHEHTGFCNKSRAGSVKVLCISISSSLHVFFQNQSHFDYDLQPQGPVIWYPSCVLGNKPLFCVSLLISTRVFKHEQCCHQSLMGIETQCTRCICRHKV